MLTSIQEIDSICTVGSKIWMIPGIDAVDAGCLHALREDSQLYLGKRSDHEQLQNGQVVKTRSRKSVLES